MGKYEVHALGALDQGDPNSQMGIAVEDGTMSGFFEDALSMAASPVGYFVGDQMTKQRQNEEAARVAMQMGTDAGYGAGQRVAESLIEPNVGNPSGNSSGGGRTSPLVVVPSPAINGEGGIFDFLSQTGPFGLSYGMLAGGLAVAGGGLYLASKRKKRKGGR